MLLLETIANYTTPWTPWWRGPSMRNSAKFGSIGFLHHQSLSAERGDLQAGSPLFWWIFSWDCTRRLQITNIRSRHLKKCLVPYSFTYTGLDCWKKKKLSDKCLILGLPFQKPEFPADSPSNSFVIDDSCFPTFPSQIITTLSVMIMKNGKKTTFFYVVGIGSTPNPRQLTPETQRLVALHACWPS